MATATALTPTSASSDERAWAPPAIVACRAGRARARTSARTTTTTAAGYAMVPGGLVPANASAVTRTPRAGRAGHNDAVVASAICEPRRAAPKPSSTGTDTRVGVATVGTVAVSRFDQPAVTPSQVARNPVG